jgi:hypothetical protein
LLTLFAMPKPFDDHIGIIQRNAVTSWTRITPRPEVILFGDEEGTARIAQKLGVRHVPHVKRNDKGTPLLNDLFEQAQNLASNSSVAYVNADIILFDDFAEAAARVAAWRPSYLMAGRRWDIDITQPIDFTNEEWADRLRGEVADRSKRRSVSWIDYFVFARGMYRDMPPLLLGRVWWDNWLVWKARQLGVPVVDSSPRVLAIHQNHAYAHPGGFYGIWHGEEGQWNERLVNGGENARTLRDANYKLGRFGIRRNVEAAVERWWKSLGKSVKKKKIPHEAANAGSETAPPIPK